MTDDLEQTEEARTPVDPIEQVPEGGAAVEDFFEIDEIFRRVLATAARELERPVSTFVWGALAAGLIIGFSFLARAVVTADVPTLPQLVGNLLYPVGFIFVIVGRYPLYTENTLTPVILALTRFASLRDLLRIWAFSYGANLAGAFLFALLLASTSVLAPDTAEMARGFGEHLLEARWLDAFYRAVLAGWRLAGLVWLVHAARETIARLLLVWLVIYFKSPRSCTTALWARLRCSTSSWWAARVSAPTFLAFSCR